MKPPKRAPAKVAPPVLTGPAKLAEVARLIYELNRDLGKICMLPHQRDAALEQLKVYGRDSKDADPMFTNEGIETITRHAFNSPSFTTSRCALRCLANAMLLNPSARARFVELHYEKKLCQRLKNGNQEDELLVSRIIFLTTYGGNIDIENLIDHHHLADNINHNIARHAKQYDEVHKIEEIQSDRPSYSFMKGKRDKSKENAKSHSNVDSSGPDPIEDMSLVETLKLLFNITHFCPQRNEAFSPAIPNILRLILKCHVLPDQPMEPPMTQLVNALMNLELETNASALYPSSDPKEFAGRLIDLLDLATTAYPEQDLDRQVSPIVSLMRKVYGLAPRQVKLHMRTLLLPPADDRAQLLGEKNALCSRILRLSTSPSTPTVREELSSLLFEMSDKDASNFVQNLGCSFSSGLLFQQNVQVPDNALEAWSTSDTDSMTERTSMGSRSSNSCSSIKFGIVAGKQINDITEANTRDQGTIGGSKDDERGEGEGEADDYV
ncbi:hypothetical protein V491_06059 [Pseudogymnoascus sp. VKM F-3775]|nr:hypothetical protein V491_06059 [Pseudogymnoascus sp. VKM F-3775]